MVTIEPKRLYQKVASNLKTRILNQEYNIGDRLPAERLLAEEMAVSRTVVREAIIMLEVEGMVEVIKGSGIHVVSNTSRYEPHEPETTSGQDALMTAGPFELLQARQLIESNIAEFAATQVTKQDVMELMRIQELSRKEDRARDSEWDKLFHIQVAKATQNSVLVSVIEQMWSYREQNPYWRKLHEHIEDKDMDSWCHDHDLVLKALLRKDPEAAKTAMWQHLENTKEMLFKASTFDDDMENDRFLFSDNPVIHLSSQKRQN
ncbi:transcriptional regulator ExuR [Gynuella sp.]|uniref:transcriptional regulator ExuR n=1 Tax=Gynuella sp. TaxID=2969146 RepID=UPI003D152699